MPPSQSTVAIQVRINRRHHDSRKHGSRLTGCSENRRPLRDLTRLIPRPNDVDGAAVRARLSQALEEAHRAELRVRVARGARHGDARPHQHHRGQPDARGHFVDHDAVRELAYHGARGEHGEDHVVVVAREADVFFEARDVGVGEGCFVDIVEEGADAAVG